MQQHHDQFTLDIIQSNLRTISQEMFTIMKRTSVSPIIYEVLDMGCALTDGDGKLITSGAGLPSFIGMLNRNVRYILDAYGNNIHDGDMFISNSPYAGGITHLNDVIIAKPLFVDGKRIAWAVNMGHWPDIGGMVAGSMSADATEIFQEGIILPAIKLFDKGRLLDSVMDIFMANSRLPESISGDLWAGISANNAAHERLTEMCDKFSVDIICDAMNIILETGRAESKKALKTLPKGSFTTPVIFDGHDVFSLTCTVSNDKFSLDLTSAPPQVNAPYNVGKDGLYAAAQIVFKALSSPHTPANEGNYEPIEIITKSGTIVDPVIPAPQGLNFENRMQYFDALLRIAIEIAPDKFGAGHFSSICGTFINGPHSVTGRHISLVEPQLGGWGACNENDGTSAMFSASHGDTFNCPAEISEARYGIMVTEMALNPCQSGQGEYRGGKGLKVTYQSCTDGLRLTAAYSKGKNPTWGYANGNDGGNNYLTITGKDGNTQRQSYASNMPIDTGTQVTIYTANGGGFGNPANRNKEQVMYDLKNEYITVDTAKQVYNI